jgi:hypothetical protein
VCVEGKKDSESVEREGCSIVTIVSPRCPRTQTLFYRCNFDLTRSTTFKIGPNTYGDCNRPGFSFTAAELFAHVVAEYAPNFTWEVEQTESAASRFAKLWSAVLPFIAFTVVLCPSCTVVLWPFVHGGPVPFVHGGPVALRSRWSSGPSFTVVLWPFVHGGLALRSRWSSGPSFTVVLWPFVHGGPLALRSRWSSGPSFTVVLWPCVSWCVARTRLDGSLSLFNPSCFEFTSSRAYNELIKQTKLKQKLHVASRSHERNGDA